MNAQAPYIKQQTNHISFPGHQPSNNPSRSTRSVVHIDANHHHQHHSISPDPGPLRLGDDNCVPSIFRTHRGPRGCQAEAVSVASFQVHSDDLDKAQLELDDVVTPSKARYRMRVLCLYLCFCGGTYCVREIRYRSGYSHKDERQARILAIKMKREHFEHLLSLACVTNNHTGTLSEQEKKCEVRVQWDPERGVSLEKLDYRSIQIGIGASISEIWANEWIDSIEDVTERAKKMKTLIDEGRVQEASELVPAERPYPLSTDLELLLRME